MAKQREGKLRATKIEVNTFTKGMRKDLSKTIQAKDSYVDAQNVRLTTDLGSSIGALVNIKGNDLSVTLPSTSAVYEIKKGNNIPPPGTVLWLQINLTNQGTFTSPSFTITKTGEEALEEMMIKFVEAANTISATGIRAKRVSKLKVIVWCVGDTLVDNTGIGIIAGGFYSAPMLLPIYSSFDVLGAAYIREQNLQVPENRRSFIPDKQLGSILGPLKDIDKDKGFTYFNLQRYITPHITSSASSVSN